MFSYFDGFAEDQAKNQNGGEYDTGKDTELHIAVCRIGNEADKGRTRRATEVARKRKEREHGSAARSERYCRFAERTRPHDADGKTAKRATDKADNGTWNKADQQIRSDAKRGAGYHEGIQIELIAVFAVEGAGASHEDGKGHRSDKVAHHFADAESLLRKGRCPLADRLLRCACTEHHDHEKPKDLAFEKLGERHALFILGKERSDRCF